MPRSRTVVKRQRQNVKRQMRNKADRTKLRTLERGARTAADKTTEVRKLQSELDKAAAAGSIHRNKASRKKSRLAKAAAKSS